MSLNNKKIILGLSGGIACYKAAELLRLLRQQGAEVQVVMTESAKQFITPLTLQALSGRAVRDDLFGLEAENGMSHIELARWADMILIAPASANLIAKLSYGLADDLLTTLCLATTAPISIAPAMNVKMWENQATQTNIVRLRERGFKIYGPGIGEQACGEFGLGRLLAPEEILQNVKQAFSEKALSGKKILITAGPTQERLDPVRYFSNFSSGKMGYALAEVAALQGAEVILISGPVALTPVPAVKVVTVRSALEMHAAVFANLVDVDIFIGAAAVADYRPTLTCENKIKKTDAALSITLVRNPDILAEVARCKQRPTCVMGFAAESQQVRKHALEKLKRKKLDLIVANDISHGNVFGSDDNEVIVITKDGRHVELPKKSKKQLAAELLELTLEFVFLINN